MRAIGGPQASSASSSSSSSSSPASTTCPQRPPSRGKPRKQLSFPPSKVGVGLARRSIGGLSAATAFARHGVCFWARASPSRGVNLFPSMCPGVVVREARLEDCWEVADTHCSSFFPDYTFPLDLVLRVNRFVGLLSGFSLPPGCMRSCLVAITGGCSFEDDNNNLFIGSEGFRIGSFEGKFSFNRGTVAGILTVDTVADFLPRKGPFRLRRTGIAYISNVAVRESERRKGIAKQLIAKAEACARGWGCRSIALHCDVTNVVATTLYKNQGYRCIKVPEHANWPQPKMSPDMQFHFMMKVLTYQPLDPSH